MQHPPKVHRKHPVMGRKAALILTGLLVALAAAFVLLLPAIRAWFPSAQYHEPSPGRTPQSLAAYEAEELDSMTVSHLAGDSYTLRYRDGALLLDRGGELSEINAAYARELLEAVTQLSVEDVVAWDASEVAGHLGDMGLEPPRAAVAVRFRDGSQMALELGTAVPGTTYFYFRWSGDNGVYMCDAGVADAFSLTENRLPPVAQPVLEKTLIDRVRLRGRDGEELEMTFSTDSSGLVSGMLRAPYPYPLSADASSALLSALQNFRLGTLEGEVTPQNRAGLGLDDPLCVIDLHQKGGSRGVVNDDGQLVAEMLEEQAFRFVIGRAEGEYFYTCEYEGDYYFINRFLAAALVGAEPSRLITRNPADLGDARLSSLLVKTGAGSVDVRVVRTERVLPNNQLETDENGNVVYDTAVTLNGDPVTEAQWNALLDRLRAMTVSGDVDGEWTPGSSAPRWQIVMTTEGGTTRTIAAYAMDAFSDALAVDGVVKHYAHKEALAIAMAEWMP